MLETYCKQIDANLSDLANSKLQQTGTGSSSAHISGGNNRFLDAMNIDVAKIDGQFVGIKDRDGIWKQFQKVMKDRCQVCGSQNHKTSNNKHTNTKCNHCESDGHWSAVRVCRLQGVPAGPVTKGNDRVSIRSSNISSGTSSDYKAENAALKDRLNVQQKQMACGFLKRAQDKITSSSPDPVEYTKPSSVSLSSSIPLSLDTPSTYADISSYTVSSLDPFGQHFHIPVLVQGFNRTARVSAMIDSDATALFLSHKFAAKHHVPLKKLPHTIKGI